MPVSLNKIFSSSWFRQLLKLICSVALIYYCLTLINIKQVEILIRGTSLPLLLIALLLTVLGTVICKSFIVWHLLTKKQPVTFYNVVAINFAMRFYTIILPKAIVAGIRWNKYRKISNPKFSLVLLSFEALTALTIAALATLVFILTDGALTIPRWIIWFSLFSCILLITIMLIFFLYPNNKILTSIENILTYLGPLRSFRNLIEKWRFTASLLEISNKKNFWPIFITATINHLIFLFGSYALILSLNVDIPFTAVAWIRSAVFILVSFPISLAGIGVREVGFITLFGYYGIEADTAAAYALLALALQLVIGFIGMFFELKNFLRYKN